MAGVRIVSCALRPSRAGSSWKVVMSGMVEPVVAACTVRASEAELVRALEVPVKVTVDVPAAADADAVSVVLCAVPGVRLKVAGFAVTPVGRPVSATETGPLKPPVAVALTLIAEPVAPAVKVNEAGFMERVKPGVVVRDVTESETLAV